MSNYYKEKGRKILFIIGVAFLLVSCNSTTQKEQTSSNVTKEKELYLNHCANCHGGNLEGSFGPPLKYIYSKYKENDILKIIENGKGSMPAQDYISKEEQKVLATWLSKSKK